MRHLPLSSRAPRLALACCAALACLAALPASAACPPSCATASSVVNAAGVPGKMASAASKLQFAGDGLAPGGAAALKALAAEFKQLPAGASVSLRVGADSSLTGPAATRQAAARQRALQQALQKEGVAAGQLRFDAGG